MNPETHKLNTCLEKTKGAVLIEFAILLPFLLIIMTGILELGLILIQDNTLNKSVRESVRYVSNSWGLAGCYTNVAEDVVSDNMDNMFASNYSDFSGGTVTIEEVCINETTGVVGASATVNANCTGTPNFCSSPEHLHIRATATFPHQLIITNLLGLNFTPTLTATSIMRVQ